MWKSQHSLYSRKFCKNERNHHITPWVVSELTYNLLVTQPVILVLIMKDNLRTALTYITEHKQTIGTIAMGVIGAIVLVSLFIYNQPHGPKIVYQPAKACDMLTPAIAITALGNKVNNIEADKPAINGNTATSKCAYTDADPKVSQRAEATILVMSAINDAGIPQLKTDFTALQKKAPNAMVVTDLGDKAYFDQDSSLLYILSGKKLVLLSYGVSISSDQSPVSKPLADVEALAQKILK